MKRLLSGNEAIALGAWEGGVRFAAAYPGTPSTEVLENLAGYSGVVAEWASNEKVALDSAIGAAFAGARALAAMKHVGVNVAADSLMSASYTGVRAGLVVVAADDPGMFSSQNEQDSRQYARFAKIPCLDPADSQEAKDFTALAFQISEEFDTPVLLRSSTRVSHSKSAVEVQPPAERQDLPPLPPFERQPEKFVIIPAHARRRHPVVEERLLQLAEYAESAPFNKVTWGDRAVGVITGGIAYQYAREALPGASFLKLGMSYPLPKKLIRDFAAQVEKLVVVEEGDPFWEEQFKAMGLEVIGKEFFPLTGELSTEAVRAGADKAGLPVPPVAETSEVCQASEAFEIPPRPPALCPGCPHRAAFYAINKQKLLVMGDIGCYSIGTLPPFSSTDAIISMGASIGLTHGMNRAGSQDKVVATIGDSTFFHAGLSALASLVYNQGTSTVIILDNRTTGMTGAQGNPATGLTLQGAQAQEIDIEAVVRALGVEDVRIVDALDVKAVDEAIKEAVKADDRPSVVIVRGDCVFTKGFRRKQVVEVDLDACNGCGLCFRVGCPAILKSAELDAKSKRPKAAIDSLLCVGCDVCLQVCPRKAIYRAEHEEVLEK
jgi:indolepyruvate ferredoxin oxidoreductase alpha subunit